MRLKQTIALCLGVALLAGCSGERSEEVVIHPTALNGTTWLRSEYKIVGREVKEFSDHSGEYAVLTIKHRDKTITAECGSVWVSETGEDIPSKPVIYDIKCGDLPMGSVKLERTHWNTLYYFAGSGKHREEIALAVKKIETR